ncbi:hypothetical protein Ancab_039179 [Ancistrocladus abbreviatus]
MALGKITWAVIFCWVFSVFCSTVVCDDASEVSVKFLRAPPAYSSLNSATFVFESSGRACSNSNCTFKCELDEGISSNCEDRNVYVSGLKDGNHTFKVCTNASQGVGCASYNWTVDTVSPTAYVTASTSFTNDLNVAAYITFSEPCTGGGGFGCSSVNACKLHVYGAGQIIPYTLKILQPNLKYSILVNLSPSIQYGRAILAMDKDFCTDRAGNKFARTENSSFVVHFDRREVFVSLRTHIPEWLIQLNGEARTVLATNNRKYLKLYLYFTEPVLNSSVEIQSSINMTQGSLCPLIGKNRTNKRFGYLIQNLSSISIVTVNLNSNAIISRQGTLVSPVDPVTFLYDSERPIVRLITLSKMRSRESSITVWIKFKKPVFGFNSTHVSISGGQLQSFRELSRMAYVIEIQIQANNDTVYISVPENVTTDVAGNKNLASNVLEVRHYVVPRISIVLAAVSTASFMATCLAAGLLTVSTACLQSIGAFTKSSPPPISDPTRNLFRIACYIQVFALSKWLAITLPLEYYEFTRGLQWSIPYFSLPWETKHPLFPMFGINSSSSSYSFISRIHDSTIPWRLQSKEENLNKAAAVYDSRLTPMEYESFFENQNFIPEADYILDPKNSHGWRDFKRSMFWLVVITGSLILLHILLLSILRLRDSSEKERCYGALVFPRFEIFLIILAVPCICEASTSVIKVGITFGKLLQYQEVHQEGQQFHWYQELIRVTLGPGKRGQWTWKMDQPNSIYLTMFGALFEDLRGPPKYMLSQFSGGNSRRPASQIIASDDETEDAEAPFIQKLFGILRIYYTLLESIRRFSLGVLAGLFSANWSSKVPIITILCITFFQLFFLVLKKPFIKKRVQLVVIISIGSEVGIFATCLAVLLNEKLSSSDDSRLGVFMLLLFLLGYVPLIVNEWYALYRQVIQLDAERNSFGVGLKTALLGFLFFFLPHRMIKNLGNLFPRRNGEREAGGTTASAERYMRSSRSRSSGSRDDPWLKQLREMARASLTKERTNDPSTSTNYARWSGFWGGKKSDSSSMTSSTDYKSKPSGLYKDLEAIFASR